MLILRSKVDLYNYNQLSNVDPSIDKAYFQLYKKSFNLGEYSLTFFDEFKINYNQKNEQDDSLNYEFDLQIENVKFDKHNFLDNFALSIKQPSSQTSLISNELSFDSIVGNALRKEISIIQNIKPISKDANLNLNSESNTKSFFFFFNDTATTEIYTFYSSYS